MNRAEKRNGPPQRWDGPSFRDDVDVLRPQVKEHQDLLRSSMWTAQMVLAFALLRASPIIWSRLVSSAQSFWIAGESEEMGSK